MEICQNINLYMIKSIRVFTQAKIFFNVEPNFLIKKAQITITTI